MSRAPEDQRPGGDSGLAKAWREASRDEPPATLDDAIRAAARQAVHARPRPAAGSPFGGRWRVPLSVAAVLVVSATVTLLVAERDRFGSRSLQDQGAPRPAAPAPQAGAREPEAGLSETPARQFAEPSAPAPVTNVAPRERESARTAQPSREERKAPSSASPPSSAEKLQARTQPAEERVRPMPAQEAAPVEADHREGQPAETQQAGAASVAPAPSDVPSAQRADDSLRDAAPPAAAEPAADRAKVEAQAAAESKRAARETSAAPAAAQTGAHEATGPQAAPRAFPAAPPAKTRVPAASDADGREPKAWLDRILELRRQGKLEEAAKSLKAFRERYPAYPLPDELKSSP